MNIPENILSTLTDEQKKKVETAQSPEELLSLAKEAGNAKAVNVVLIGVLAKTSDIPYEKWVESVKKTVPEKFLEVNLKAFDLGYNH